MDEDGWVVYIIGGAFILAWQGLGFFVGLAVGAWYF